MVISGYTDDFRIEYYDEEAKERIQAHYWYKGGRFYLQYDHESGFSTKIKRISEESFISAVEEFYDA